MAATAWSFYNSFKEKLGNAVFDLDAATPNFRMALFTNSASTNANNVALSTYASIANEVANGNGYATGECPYLEGHGLLQQRINTDGMLQL